MQCTAHAVERLSRQLQAAGDTGRGGVGRGERMGRSWPCHGPLWHVEAAGTAMLAILQGPRHSYLLLLLLLLLPLQAVNDP